MTEEGGEVQGGEEHGLRALLGEGRREEGNVTPAHKEQLYTHVLNDAVEAHSCVDTDSGSPCKQLTKTFGSKRPAVE